MKILTKYKFLIALSSIISVSMITCGCGNNEIIDHVQTIRDLTYKHGLQEELYTVWLIENGTYEPYLVLSDDYDNNCLLLRKNLMDDNLMYNYNAPLSAYYSGSIIDNYLQDDFINRLDENLVDRICDTSIFITRKECLYTGQPQTEIITRKVFLLSYTEIFGNGFSIIASEGTQLSFFFKGKNRIAKHVTDISDHWWLRTPETWYDTLVCVVEDDGSLGVASIGGLDGETKNAIRPAFCLDRNTKIIKENEKYYLCT